MGATDFSIVSWGVDALSAYESARQAATAEYGTDPYNGTISTTHGFVLVTPPAGWTDLDVEEIGWLLEGADPDEEPPTEEMPEALAAKWAALSPSDRRALLAAGQFEKRGSCVAVPVTSKLLVGVDERRVPFRFYGLGAS